MPGGRNDRMERLITFAKELTGKTVEWRDGWWYQKKNTIIVPKGDFEGLLHEVCHYVVATDTEREAPNLQLTQGCSIWKDGEMVSPCASDLKRSVKREKQACFLEMELLDEAGVVLKAVMNEESVHNLQYDTNWRDGLSARSKGGYRAFLTRKFKRLRDGLRDELVEVISESVCG